MMKQYYYIIPLTFLLPGIFDSCSSNPEKKSTGSKEEGSIQKTDSSFVQKKSVYDELLKKFKPISFDTLKVDYNYDKNDKRFSGKELTLKETKALPVGFRENDFGKLSGVYACYQFPLDSTRLGLITRIPSEYESSSIVLLTFDRKENKFLDNYFYLGTSNGDAGEISSRVSWLFRTKTKQVHSFVYDYQSYHEIDDTLTTEFRYYFTVNCMKPTFDTLSSNQNELKKRFKDLLLTEE